MHTSIHIAQKILEKSYARNIPDMTTMKLLKLVYISHGWMLGLYDRALVSEDVEAWQYGPVIPELYREIKIYKDRPVEHLDSRSDASLDGAENSIIDQVLTGYGQLSGFKLSNITHAKGTPWHTVWHDCQYDVIPHNLIKQYYKGLASRAGQY